MEVAGLSDGGFLRQVRNLEDIDFSLVFGNLVFKLVATFGERFVFRAEPSFVDHAGLVVVVELVDLPSTYLL